MLKVAVVYGGESTEHDISIKSSRFVVNNIEKEKYEVTEVYIDKAGIWYDNTVTTFNETNNWLIRGGNVTENYKGLYAYGGTPDNASEYLSTRIVIK